VTPFLLERNKMELKTDHSFHIGEQHLRTGKPNQDYALSGSLQNGAAYAIVSDGCSSGGQTDIGSRLLSLATKRAIAESANDAHELTFVNRVRDAYAETFRTTLGLAPNDLLATCLFAVAWDDEVFINVTGDGVIALQFRDELSLSRFTWERNMPYYPAYRLAGEDDAYSQAMAEYQNPLTEYYYPTESDAAKSRPYTITQGMKGITIQARSGYCKNNPRPLRAVGLFSDGVEQVDGMETQEVVSALMSFKSTSGKFVTRRMNRFLQAAKKSGRGPIDDIAMAVIHLGQNSET
jgi:hypothetical protein